jgi:hypothetical protein
MILNCQLAVAHFQSVSHNPGHKFRTFWNHFGTEFWDRRATESGWSGVLGGLGNDLCDRMCNAKNFAQQDFALPRYDSQRSPGGPPTGLDHRGLRLTPQKRAELASRGICFRPKANPNGLKMLDSGSILARKYARGRNLRSAPPDGKSCRANTAHRHSQTRPPRRVPASRVTLTLADEELISGDCWWNRVIAVRPE